MDNPRLFYCYSITLKSALDANGFKPLTNDPQVHNKTKKKYWMYFSSEELDKYRKNKYPFQKDNFRRLVNS